MVDTLKNCPFCGEQCATLEINQGYKWAHYEAGCLEVCTGYIMDEGANWRTEAILVWNTRTSDTQIESLTAQLEAALAANEVNRLAIEKLEGELLVAQHDIRFLEGLLENETKEIINLSAVTSSLVGYLSALDGVEDNDDFNWVNYKRRLEDYYIKNLQAAVKVFVDRLGE